MAHYVLKTQGLVRENSTKCYKMPTLTSFRNFTPYNVPQKNTSNMAHYALKTQGLVTENSKQQFYKMPSLTYFSKFHAI